MPREAGADAVSLTCDNCKSVESWAYVGILTLCRRCAGTLVSRLIGWIKDFDRERGRPRKRPKNPDKPIVDSFGQTRCRDCEVHLKDWKPGDSPRCDLCRTAPRP